MEENQTLLLNVQECRAPFFCRKPRTEVNNAGQGSRGVDGRCAAAASSVQSVDAFEGSRYTGECLHERSGVNERRGTMQSCKCVGQHANLRQAGTRSTVVNTARSAGQSQHANSRSVSITRDVQHILDTTDLADWRGQRACAEDTSSRRTVEHADATSVKHVASTEHEHRSCDAPQIRMRSAERRLRARCVVFERSAAQVQAGTDQDTWMSKRDVTRATRHKEATPCYKDC